MATPFDAWNACVPRIDQYGDPQFCFDFRVVDEEVLFFFILSARVTEVITDTEWELNVGGTVYDVPNIHARDIKEVIDVIDYKFGYEYDLFHVPLEYKGTTINIPIIHWINLESGFIEMYVPGRGLQKLRQVRHASKTSHTINQKVIMINSDKSGNITSSMASALKGVGSVASLIAAILAL